jgi:hypothetical protein
VMTYATLISAFFRAVSFETAQRPAYDAIRELFADGGKLIRAGSKLAETWTVDDFIASRWRMVDSGALTSFRETEIGAITEVFANVAHRFSTYEKRGMMNGTPIAGRGLISTQFIGTPDGWRISSMAWDDERPGLTIPARYLSPPADYV